MERDLKGRCGTCAFYIALREDERGAEGDCRLGCWPSPLRDTATCANHKPVGTSWDDALKRKKVAGAPRRYAEERDEPPPPPTIPQEIGIDMDQDEFRKVLREVILDELGVRTTPIGDRWRGGEVVLVPGKKETQEKRMPIDALFHKIVLIRDKLRVLEQKVNGHKGLEADEKIQMQQYITACYGSLTSFNLLFREREDGFRGQSSDKD